MPAFAGIGIAKNTQLCYHLMMQITIAEIADEQNFDRKDWPEGTIIFSDEWQHRRKQVQGYLDSKTKKYTRTIYARLCSVDAVSNDLAKEFLDDNHIQGSNNLTIKFFGLRYKGELVGVMSLGRHSRQIAENRIVLDRFCIKNSVHIPGGASKLFKYAAAWAKEHKYDEIISFSDNRWTEGEIYQTLGFSLEKEHKPDYCYVDTNNPTKRLSKQSQKKSSSHCPEGMTEFEWAEKRGLKKLWDKGKKRWVYILNPNKTPLNLMQSIQCAGQHRDGVFKHSHIRGYFKSEKSGEVYYGSSYELRCEYLLENNECVKHFQRGYVFIDSIGGARNPDLQVEYIDGSKEIIEVKPKGLLNQPEVVKQIEESKLYAASKGCKFSLWTEDHSGLNDEKAIINWAKKFIAETTGDTQWIERQAVNSRNRAKKHYHNVIKQDTEQVYCEYCQKTHVVLRKTYKDNIARNGSYICESYGGFLSGSQPKLHLRKNNPYLQENKKQCNKCKEIKLLTEFSPDKTKRDGYSTRCKVCRAEIYRLKYNKKT